MPDAPFAIQAGALRQALAFAPRIIHRRNTIPILAHVLLQAAAGVLTVRATDMEVYFTTTAEGSGDLPAVTVAPGPLLTMLAILPPEETVELSIAKAGQLELSAGTTRARLFTMPAEDRPTGREWTPTAQWTIHAGALRTLLRRARHAISTADKGGEAVSANQDHKTKVYSAVMRFTEREKRAPAVLEVAKLTKLGTLHVAAAVGDLNWLFLHGSGSDPAQCSVEVDGE